MNKVSLTSPSTWPYLKISLQKLLIRQVDYSFTSPFFSGKSKLETIQMCNNGHMRRNIHLRFLVLRWFLYYYTGLLILKTPYLKESQATFLNIKMTSRSCTINISPLENYPVCIEKDYKTTGAGSPPMTEREIDAIMATICTTDISSINPINSRPATSSCKEEDDIDAPAIKKHHYIRKDTRKVRAAYVGLQRMVESALENF